MKRNDLQHDRDAVAQIKLPIISMVRHAAATKTHDVSADVMVKAIQSCRWEKPIKEIRSVFADVLLRTGDRKAAKQAVDGAKKNLAGTLWSGRFSRRTNDAMIQHSGLLCADLDQLGRDKLWDVRRKLIQSEHLYALFRSPTGDGLKAVFCVSADASTHLASFCAVEQHVLQLSGTSIDYACKDVARICFVSFDPFLYSNTNAREIAPLPQSQDSQSERASGPLPADITLRQCIAVEFLGEIQWVSETHGFCTCPGKHLHTTGDARRDCEINLSAVPTIHCFHDHCRAICEGVNHELRSRIGKEEARRGGKSDTPAQWQDPQPLPADMPAVPPFNFECLPGTLGPWIQDISERMQCPPEFPAVGAMIALASVVGRKVGIKPKRHDDWLEVPNLWGGVVGRPGLLKTPSLQQALIPLRRLAAESFKRYERENREHDIGDMLGAQRKKLIEETIRKDLKAGREADARDKAAVHLDAAREKPVCRRYEVNDSTIEKLGELLAENPNGLLLVRDELSGFLRLLDREDRAGDRAKYLEMWDGKGELTYDRIGRGTVIIPSNTLSILGGIQPDVLMAHVREAVRGGAGNDGLLQRFQLVVWPDVSKQWRNVDHWPDTKAKNDAFAVFEYVDNLTVEAAGADTSEGIPFLRFTKDAQEHFGAWRAELEKRLRSDTEHPAFEAHLAKYRKLVPALALLIHLANRQTGSVSLEALKKALLWADYLEAHARRIYSAVLRPDTAAARELAKHLQHGDLAERFTLRETYRKGWTGLATKEDAEAATEILCDFGWIRALSENSR